MTTSQYRWLVAGQVCLIGLLGLGAALVTLGAIPRYRVRRDFAAAADYYGVGTEQAIRLAQEKLDRVLARNPEMRQALALRGRISIEQGNLSAAYDAYERLEAVLSQEALPTAPATNGLACATLLKALQPGEDREALLGQAYARFKQAIEENDQVGDPHVNAAICALHRGDVVRAAAHLEDARSTRDLTYESMVAYYSAVGSLLAATSTRSADVVRAVTQEFNDPDPELAQVGWMVQRAALEFDKAAELARADRARVELQIHAALAKARCMVYAPAPGAYALPGWAPLPARKAREYLNAVRRVMSERKTLLDARQRQLLRVALAVALERRGSPKRALFWVRRAIADGPLSPEVRFYVGMALFQTARSPAMAQLRAALEAEAIRHLLEVLEAGPAALSPQQKFYALAEVAHGLWYAGDREAALRRMTEAARALRLLETRSARPPLPARRRRFYRNLAIMQYRTGKAPEALQSLARSLRIEKKQKNLLRFLKQLDRLPSITDVAIIAAPKLPPNFPILRARVRPEGARPLRKEYIKMEIDGAEVTEFYCGPGGFLYAIPRRALNEGKHTAQITVTMPGRPPVTKTQPFEVKFNYKLVGS